MTLDVAYFFLLYHWRLRVECEAFSVVWVFELNKFVQKTVFVVESALSDKVTFLMTILSHSFLIKKYGFFEVSKVVPAGIPIDIEIIELCHVFQIFDLFELFKISITCWINPASIIVFTAVFLRNCLILDIWICKIIRCRFASFALIGLICYNNKRFSADIRIEKYGSNPDTIWKYPRRWLIWRRFVEAIESWSTYNGLRFRDAFHFPPIYHCLKLIWATCAKNTKREKKKWSKNVVSSDMV